MDIFKTIGLFRKFCFCLCFLWASQNTSAQNTSYFQQQTNYEIAVKLDDQQHFLHGQWALEYTNNSPNELSFLYIHLWPNAYQSPGSAFGQQQLLQHETAFYFADKNQHGFIDSLDFSLKKEDQNITLVIEETEHADVIKVLLPEAIKHGESIRLETSFRVKIPDSFSRLGHIGQSYQITQWYPKPAVYDQTGWHPMPYLDIGEFYSEFGRFEVEITLPKNYWVAATGTLETVEEIARLNDKAEQDKKLVFSENDHRVWLEPSFPVSNTAFKTIRYTAENVHDFAWFADKRFHVLKDTLQIDADKTIDVWAFFTDREAHLWQQATHYLKRSTQYYSDRVGTYPYPQVTAVQSTLSMGVGMEYPMITLIGEEWTEESLDEVITHEVGHNWFYGILGSNERESAWMDEGMNSFYEREYMAAFHEETPDFLPTFLQAGSKMDEIEFDYCRMARLRKDQAPTTSSDDFSLDNYWISAYEKPSEALLHLQAMVGKKKMDAAMQAYYEAWKFKHPSPTDFQQSLENSLGQNLDWIFKEQIASTAHQNYAIENVRIENDSVIIHIKNVGKVGAPIVVSATYKDGNTATKWTQMPPGASQHLLFDAKNIQFVQLDPGHETLEIDRTNDTWRAGFWGKKRPPRLRLLTGLPNEAFNDIYFLPFPAYNKYDGLMPGLAVSNSGLLPQSFEWLLAPMYGTNTKKLAGGAGLRHRWWPEKGRIQEINLQVNFRQFHFDEYMPGAAFLRYRRFVPSIQFFKKNHPNVQRTQSLQWRSIWLEKQNTSFSNIGEFLGLETQDTWLHELSYKHIRTTALSPYQLKIALEQYAFQDAFDRSQNHLLLQIDGHGKWLYQSEKAIHWRIYGGFFLNNTLSSSSSPHINSLSLFDRGGQDYRFDNLYFGRSETEDWTQKQLAARAGGFKAPVASAFPIGYSNKWLFSVNLSTDLPFTPTWLPLKPYLDAGYLQALSFGAPQTELLWNGGLAMEWLDGKIGIYLPLVGSSQIKDRLAEAGGVAERISFRLILSELTPWKLLEAE